MVNSSVYTEKVILTERNNGLKGASLDFIIQHPNDIDKLIAKGKAGNYYSIDKGEHWRLLQLDDYKFEGGRGYNAPNVFWNKVGIMVAIVHNWLYWSNDGFQWQSKWMDLNVDEIGTNKENELWLKRVTKNEDVYEWILWSTDNQPYTKSIEERGEIKRIISENLDYLRNSARGWKIMGNLIYNFQQDSNRWQEKSEGLKRPIIHYFMQDANHPEYILAASSTGAYFSGGFKKNKDLVYWASKDFGENWYLTDSSIFSQWSLADTLLLDRKHCNLSIDNNRAFIGNNIIKSNYGFIKAIEQVGWVDDKRYYSIGQEGIQLGVATKKCAYKKQILWTWSNHNWENKIRYHISSLNNYSRLYAITAVDSLAEPNYITKEYKKALTLLKGDSLKFIIPCSYGGLWFAKVPLERPVNFHRFLHICVQYRLIIYLNLLYIIYIVVFFNRDR